MDYLLYAVLGAVIIYALCRTVIRLRKGSSCCTEGEAVALRRVNDRNKEHYPYHVTMEIGGMTCENCARKVANTINAVEGLWAVVSYENKTADVRAKSAPDEALLRRLVSDAGYVVMDFRQLSK